MGYYEHGLEFFLCTYGTWEYESPKGYAETWVEMKEEVYTLNESYQNAVADDVITLDENRCYQGHLSAESIDSNEKTYKRENFIFVGTAENGIGYFFTLDIKEERTDAETNIILEELSQCYGIDLTAYGNDPSELTKGGKYSRTDQDEYVQRSDENEVIKAKDYTYMGIAEQESNYGHIYQLLIPMGKDTRASDYGLSANMHGVYVEVGISSGWGEPDVIAEAEEVVESRRSSWEGNPNDLRDI